MYDAFIYVYRLNDPNCFDPYTYLYREIPVGSAVNEFNRPADFKWKVKFKNYTLPLDSPVKSYSLSLKDSKNI